MMDMVLDDPNSSYIMHAGNITTSFSASPRERCVVVLKAEVGSKKRYANLLSFK